MTDNPLLAGYQPPPPRQQLKPGEVVWTMVKDGKTARAELRHHGAVGVELQVFLGEEFANGRMHASRKDALEAAERRRLQMIERGWKDLE